MNSLTGGQVEKLSEIGVLLLNFSPQKVKTTSFKRYVECEIGKGKW